jgi:hypothetical protein
MIRVRFSTGLVLQYNDVNHLDRGANYTDARAKKGDYLIAQIPNDCVIEYVFPCRIYQQRGGTVVETIARVERLTMQLRRARRVARELRTKLKVKR